MAGAPSQAALGFSVKSGWASAVLLAGTPREPSVVQSARLDLSDPAVPDSRQPYHEGFGTARRPGATLTRLIASVERFGRQSVGSFIVGCQAARYRLKGAGMVVGSLIDPSGIGNDHIRIHALEGQLFRGVVRAAIIERRLRCAIWRERDLYGSGAEVLKLGEADLRARVTSLGRAAGGPWRAEHKAAALAAWLVLAGARGRAADEKVRRTAAASGRRKGPHADQH
jgi:hypothetical protein